MTDSRTALHYTPNGNIVNGVYVPAVDGFNLADVSSVDQVDALPTGVEALVWLGLTNGVDANFINTIAPYIGNPGVFGFYLADEPDPTGVWGPLVTAANLKAESDYIHAYVPGAKTFIVMMNLGSDTNPSYMNTYNPANTGIDLYGIDPYPVRPQFSGGMDLGVIPAAVTAVEAAGVPLDKIVPVYQAFGGGDYSSWTLPTATQETQILATWGAAVPTPAFDYTYSWGSQGGDTALAQSPALQQVFAQHNAVSGTITGTPGNDTITGTSGADTMAGGLGDDSYYVNDPSDVVTELAGQGTDTVYASVNYTLTAGSVVEFLRADAGTTGLALNGNELANTIIGRNGNDTLGGGAGDDILKGAAGADVMAGGLGNDQYYVDNPGDVVAELAGQGTDTVWASVNYALTSGAEVEFLRANAGTTGLALTGNEFANTITGGAGSDTLTGGAGADHFRFMPVSGPTGPLGGIDTITDFSSTEKDLIDLRLIDANDLLAGNQAFKFIGTNAFSGNAGELRYAAAGANTLISGDVNGDGAADFSILLSGSHTLSAADFVR